MNKLKTLNDLHLGLPPEDFVHVDDLQDAVKEHITKLCKDMELDEKTIGAMYHNERGIFSFTYDEPRSKYKTKTVALVAWIKYFFDLEEK